MENTNTPISTYKTELKFRQKGSNDNYNVLCPIKEFPDLIGQPELIEVTTMSDRSQKFIPGVEQLEALAFTANYTKAAFQKLWDMRGTEHDFAVYFGDEGKDGIFELSGQLSPSVPGAAVNEAVDMTITIYPSSEIVFKNSVAGVSRASTYMPNQY